ncbi:MAG: hypothetical protein A2086_15610 [Spirochaetes bacterium GWD1_27_9]|nr:MAG: hypothetical protein A2Z98_14230 [Spirochaetes bacterium GWB1_27_13]OHD22492.1 MAG: hypothetical protein A2Y34_06735 [Spirochaetes bacterium GWC1_27_15]OHD42808.1 MAG: hypothetical protein A2086_15610 [Spirochaetes bacterium GWD1_27_9]
MKNEKILYIGENKYYTYSIKENKIEEVSDLQKEIKDIKKIVISDNLIELKVITVPQVADRLLLNIVKNTIKRYALYDPEKDLLDYEIIDKEENKYSILVFICRNKDFSLFAKKQMFSVYNVLEILIEDRKIPDNCQLLIKSGDIYYLYIIIGKIFRKREIHFPEDIKNIPKENTYLINLLHDENLPDFDFTYIPLGKLDKSLMSLKGGIFETENTSKQINKFIIGIVFLFLIMCYLIFYNYNISKNYDDLFSQKKNIESKIQKYRMGGEDVKLYENYKKIVKDKKDIIDFFYYFYEVSKKNIKIDNLNFSNSKFNIQGECFSDSDFEKSIHNATFFKNVNLIFSKKEGKILFRLEGEFIYDKTTN